MCVGYMQPLYHITEGTWASMDFAICGVPGPVPQGHQEVTAFAHASS